MWLGNVQKPMLHCNLAAFPLAAIPMEDRLRQLDLGGLVTADEEMAQFVVIGSTGELAHLQGVRPAIAPMLCKRLHPSARETLACQA